MIALPSSSVSSVGYQRLVDMYRSGSSSHSHLSSSLQGVRNLQDGQRIEISFVISKRTRLAVSHSPNSLSSVYIR